MATNIIMPEMGEGVIEGTIVRWLKAEGEVVEQYEPVLEIETDKVTTEATAEDGGILLQILVAEGETVSVGTVLAVLGETGESAPDTPETTSPTSTAPQPPVTKPEVPMAVSNGTAVVPNAAAVLVEPRRYTGRISPVVGRIAAEHSVDLDWVPGSGREGRITKNDVLAYIEARGPQPQLPATPATVLAPPQTAVSQPSVSTSPAPVIGAADELVPLTGMRRAIAEHMVRSKQTSPHVTTVFEFDFTAVATHRAANKAQFARDGARLTFTAYIVAAVIQALKQHPMVNSSWRDEGVVLRRDINIGMATAIDAGLIVPVIKQADNMNLLGLARTINDLAERARTNRLQPNEVQGGTFTLTNHGVSGSLFATPIINQPQCGILGAGMIEKRVKVINNAIAIRPMAYISFTFDHRILDGATADYFVGSIKEMIENWS